jgi:phage portal protein BeeE
MRSAQHSFRSLLAEHIASSRPTASFTELINLYATGATIYSAANYVANNLALVDYEVRDEKDRRVDHPIQRVFGSTFSDFMRRTSLSMSFRGASLAEKIRTFTHVTRLRWINFGLWQTDTGYREGLKGFRISGSGNSEPLPQYLIRANAVYTHLVDFRDDFDGTSPAEVAYLHAGIDVEAATTQLAFFQNMAVPLMHIQPTADQNYRPQKEERDQLANLIRRSYQGAGNSGRTLITPTRWEMQRYQIEFDKLDFETVTKQAREAVFMAFQVPIELVLPSSSGYAQAYESRRGWLETSLKPMADWYADQFTEQLVELERPGWRVVATFRNVPGFRLDLTTRTQAMRDQVQSSLVDLYTAQHELGVRDPDPRLRDMYMVQGVPVHVSEIRDFWKVQRGAVDQLPQPPGQVPQASAAPRPTEDDPVLAPQPERPTSAGKSLDFIPDDAFKEIKNWEMVAGRKGALHPFEARQMEADTAAYGKFLLATDMPIPDAFALIRSDAADSGRKDYSKTAAAYRRTLYDLLTQALTETLTREAFGTLGRAEVSTAFKAAYIDGLRTGGVETDELEPEETWELAMEITSERKFWTALANEVYREALPLLQRARVARQAGLDTADGLFDSFNKARMNLIERVDLWVNSLRSINQLGLLSAKKNQMLRWELGATMEHCETCATANGQVHRASAWKRRGLRPGVHTLKCKGYYCDCRFKVVKGKAFGDLKSIPLHDSEEGEE